MTDLLAVFSYRLSDLANATIWQWFVLVISVGLILKLIGGK